MSVSVQGCTQMDGGTSITENNVDRISKLLSTLQQLTGILQYDNLGTSFLIYKIFIKYIPLTNVGTPASIQGRTQAHRGTSITR